MAIFFIKSRDWQVAGNQNLVCTQLVHRNSLKTPIKISGHLKKSESDCFKFRVTSNSSLKLNTNIKTILEAPNGTREVISGERTQKNSTRRI